MYCSIRLLKFMGLSLGLFLLVLVLGDRGLLIAAEKAAINVVPNVIDTNAKKVTVSGTGFTPDSQITVGFPDVPTHKELPFAKGMWVSVITTDKSGVFSTDVQLSRTLWRLNRIIGRKKVPGVYTVKAKNVQGDAATASLEVKMGKKKKKK